MPANNKDAPRRGGGEARKPRGGEPRLRRIARRAHELFLARGAGHGNDLEDWLQAEREIDEEMQKEETEN
jgi:hypothetical protein